MELRKILTGFLSKTLNMDDGKIAELLDAENATEEQVTKALLDFDVSRVAELKKSVDQAKFQDGYKKAKGEVLSELEKELKSSFSFDGTEQGVDLVKAIVTKASTGGNGGKGNLTDEDVKKHPLFLNLQDAHAKKAQEIETQWQEKYTNLENTHKKDVTVAGIKSKAFSVLDGLNPIYPTTEAVRNNLKNTFAKTFEGFDYQEVDGRTLILENGKVKEDLHGNRVDLDSFIKETAANYFEFKQNNGGGNEGGGDDKGNGGNGGGANLEPKTLEDLTKIADDPNISNEDKQKAFENFDKIK